MTTTQMADALLRAEQLLFATPVLEAFIARREAGVEPDDSETAGALARELVACQAEDGSWGANLGLTAETLLLLSGLQDFDEQVNASIAHGVDWLRSRQRRPGSFVDRCSPDLHDAALCHHLAGGFFSPGPRSVSLAGAILPNGARFRSDDDARLALSAVALRAVLSIGSPTRDDLLQIDALKRMTEFLFYDSAPISTIAAVTVIATLSVAPRTAELLAAVHRALSRLARQQRADASWLDTDPFHVAEVFLSARFSGYGSPLFDAALARTAELLVLTQKPDGSWGNESGPYRLLTGWRVLRYALEHQ